MIRTLIFLVLLILVAAGFGWLADRPGEIAMVWQGQRYETSLAVGLTGVLLLAIAFGLVWSLLRLFFNIPSLVGLATRARRHRKGMTALSRGMIAAGAGDSRTAQRASADASRYLGEEPLTLLLRAQTHQLTGNRAGVEATFRRLAELPETRLIGLRGLHVEAKRRGDAEAAHRFAERAHKMAPLAWAGHAVLEHHAAHGEWNGALAAVDANFAQGLIDKSVASRQRAVLQTAIALALGDRDESEALRLAREAAGLAPDLVPAVTLAARLLARRGDIRKAARLIEAAWRRGPHPDLAATYLNLRHGDSARDRLNRARALTRIEPTDIESRLCLAQAALDARDFGLARKSLAPLVDADASTRPTVRTCLLMAELEEREHGAAGLSREWLARASRAARDRTWVADGVTADTWSPISPATGALDAFRWQIPAERVSAVWEAPPARVEPSPPPALPHVDPVAEPAAGGPMVDEAAAANHALRAPEEARTPVLVAEPAPVVPAPVLPAPVAALPAFDAKLSEIRASAKQGEAREVFPLANAPDDPGPERKRSRSRL